MFSGTQVGSDGASLHGCQTTGRDLEALVAVQAGLRDRPSEQSMLPGDKLVQGPTGRWRIADITDTDDLPFRLSDQPRGAAEAERLSAQMGPPPVAGP